MTLRIARKIMAAILVPVFILTNTGTGFADTSYHKTDTLAPYSAFQALENDERAQALKDRGKVFEWGMLKAYAQELAETLLEKLEDDTKGVVTLEGVRGVYTATIEDWLRRNNVPKHRRAELMKAVNAEFDSVLASGSKAVRESSTGKTHYDLKEGDSRVKIAGVEILRHTAKDAKAKVLIIDPIDETVIDDMRREGNISFDIIQFVSEPMTNVQLRAIADEVKDYTAIMPFVRLNIDADLMDRLPQLKHIVHWSTGYNNTDFKAAKERGILVTFAPGPLTIAMAELNMGLMLDANYRITDAIYVEEDADASNTLERLREGLTDESWTNVVDILWGELLRRSLRLDRMFEFARSGRWVGAGTGPDNTVLHNQLGYDEDNDIGGETILGIATDDIAQDRSAMAILSIARAHRIKNIFYTGNRHSEEYERENGLVYVEDPAELSEQATFTIRTGGAEIEKSDKVIDISRLAVRDAFMDILKPEKRLQGKTLAIAGMGRIGTAFARRAKALGMDILGYDRYQSAEALELARFTDDKDDLFREADVFDPLLTLTDETRDFVTGRELNLMKRGVVILSTARGPIYDEDALVKFLRENESAQFRGDVIKDEVNNTKDNALVSGLANSRITGHTGSAIIAVRRMMAMVAMENLVALVRGERPPHIIKELDIEDYRASSSGMQVIIVGAMRWNDNAGLFVNGKQKDFIMGRLKARLNEAGGLRYGVFPLDEKGGFWYSVKMPEKADAKIECNIIVPSARSVEGGTIIAESDISVIQEAGPAGGIFKDRYVVDAREHNEPMPGFRFVVIPTDSQGESISIRASGETKGFNIADSEMAAYRLKETGNGGTYRGVYTKVAMPQGMRAIIDYLKDIDAKSFVFYSWGGSIMPLPSWAERVSGDVHSNEVHFGIKYKGGMTADARLVCTASDIYLAIGGVKCKHFSLEGEVRASSSGKQGLNWLERIRVEGWMNRRNYPAVVKGLTGLVTSLTSARGIPSRKGELDRFDGKLQEFCKIVRSHKNRDGLLRSRAFQGISPTTRLELSQERYGLQGSIAPKDRAAESRESSAGRLSSQKILPETIRSLFLFPSIRVGEARTPWYFDFDEQLAWDNARMGKALRGEEVILSIPEEWASAFEKGMIAGGSVLGNALREAGYAEPTRQKREYAIDFKNRRLIIALKSGDDSIVNMCRLVLSDSESADIDPLLRLEREGSGGVKINIIFRDRSRGTILGTLAVVQHSVSASHIVPVKYSVYLTVNDRGGPVITTASDMEQLSAQVMEALARLKALPEWARSLRAARASSSGKMADHIRENKPLLISGEMLKACLPEVASPEPGRGNARVMTIGGKTRAIVEGEDVSEFIENDQIYFFRVNRGEAEAVPVSIGKLTYLKIEKKDGVHAIRYAYMRIGDKMNNHNELRSDRGIVHALPIDIRYEEELLALATNPAVVREIRTHAEAWAPLLERLNYVPKQFMDTVWPNGVRRGSSAGIAKGAMSNEAIDATIAGADPAVKKIIEAMRQDENFESVLYGVGREENGIRMILRGSDSCQYGISIKLVPSEDKKRVSSVVYMGNALNHPNTWSLADVGAMNVTVGKNIAPLVNILLAETLGNSPVYCQMVRSTGKDPLRRSSTQQEGRGSSAGKIITKELLLTHPEDVARSNLDEARAYIMQNTLLDEAQKNGLIAVLGALFEASLGYFKDGAESNPIYHNTQVVANMARIGLEEGLGFDDLKLALVLALLHDIGNARSEREKVQGSRIKAALAKGDKPEALRLANMSMEYRLEHMDKGPELIRDVIAPYVEDGRISMEEAELLCEVTKIHDYPSIEKSAEILRADGVDIGYGIGHFLLPLDEHPAARLARLLREADRLFMVSYQGVIKDLIGDKADVTPEAIRAKLQSNMQGHRDEYDLYVKAERDDGNFIGGTLYRTKAGYGIFSEAPSVIEAALSSNRESSAGKTDDGYGDMYYRHVSDIPHLMLFNYVTPDGMALVVTRHPVDKMDGQPIFISFAVRPDSSVVSYRTPEVCHEAALYLVNNAPFEDIAATTAKGTTTDILGGNGKRLARITSRHDGSIRVAVAGLRPRVFTAKAGGEKRESSAGNSVEAVTEDIARAMGEQAAYAALRPEQAASNLSQIAVIMNGNLTNGSTDGKDRLIENKFGQEYQVMRQGLGKVFHNDGSRGVVEVANRDELMKEMRSFLDRGIKVIILDDGTLTNGLTEQDLPEGKACVVTSDISKYENLGIDTVRFINLNAMAMMGVGVLNRDGVMFGIWYGIFTGEESDSNVLEELLDKLSQGALRIVRALPRIVRLNIEKLGNTREITKLFAVAA